MTKKELKERCKQILNSSVSEVSNKSDFEFLMSVFQNHNEWDIKRGVGVEKILIKISPNWGNKCFYLKRLDGTETDISYNQSISPDSKLADIKKACRYSIQPLISEFRGNLNFPITCPITGDILYSHSDVEIDHYDSTFNEVVLDWLSGKDLNKIELNKTEDNNSITRFISDDVMNDFINFYNNHTHLRAVSVLANRSILRRKH